MIEAEYSMFFRWVGWRKIVEAVEYDLRWKLWERGHDNVYIPPGVFVLVNPNFFLK